MIIYRSSSYKCTTPRAGFGSGKEATNQEIFFLEQSRDLEL
jgi:hypothetical protein